MNLGVGRNNEQGNMRQSTIINNIANRTSLIIDTPCKRRTVSTATAITRLLKPCVNLNAKLAEDS